MHYWLHCIFAETFWSKLQIPWHFTPKFFRMNFFKNKSISPVNYNVIKVPNKSNSNSLKSKPIWSFSKHCWCPSYLSCSSLEVNCSSNGRYPSTLMLPAQATAFLSKSSVVLAWPCFPLNGASPKGLAVQPQEKDSTNERQDLVSRYSSFLALLRDIAECALCSHKGSPQTTEPPWPTAEIHSLAQLALAFLLSLFHSAVLTMSPRMIFHVNILHADSCLNIHFWGHQTKTIFKFFPIISITVSKAKGSKAKASNNVFWGFRVDEKVSPVLPLGLGPVWVDIS